jgi:hypothetical protein
MVTKNIHQSKYLIEEANIQLFYDSVSTAEITCQISYVRMIMNNESDGLWQ